MRRLAERIGFPRAHRFTNTLPGRQALEAAIIISAASNYKSRTSSSTYCRDRCANVTPSPAELKQRWLMDGPGFRRDEAGAIR